MFYHAPSKKFMSDHLEKYSTLLFHKLYDLRYVQDNAENFDTCDLNKPRTP